MEDCDDLAITEELVKLVTGQFDLASVLTLPLPGLGIRSVEGLAPLRSLTSLDISSNRISKIDGLDKLAGSLVRLDLRDNNVTRLEALQPLLSLEVVRLQGNKISELDTVIGLASLPRLRAVHLQDLGGASANPVCSAPRYKETVSRRLKALTCLDSEYFVSDEYRPRRVGDGDGEDIVLPEVEKWVPKGFFDSVLASQRTGPPPFQAQEQSLRALLQDCKQTIAQADVLFAQAQTPTSKEP
eukprot:TRINITY_DN6444_c0_g1_i1.p1 TRINITY_DN6444_c0_g1~~TRINITY_DN6444_c0_g1_i1.p1  ORF type:complete len:260 (+),score=88.83 TRINITY_DN6444_c0_g1_i1:57-782(+)